MTLSSFAFRNRLFRRVAVLGCGFVSILVVYGAVDILRTVSDPSGQWQLNYKWRDTSGSSAIDAGASPTSFSAGATRLPGCLRPRLSQQEQPEVESAAKTTLRCSGTEQNWIRSTNGTFSVDESIQRRHGPILCQYSAIMRDNDDFRVVRGKPIKPMLNNSPLTSDAFEARCVGSDGSVHVGTYSGISFQPEVAKRCQKRTGNGDSDDVLDILIFGFDSVSRLAWSRQLPETFRYIVEELRATVVDGYNIVGDGTPQALLPLLTGKTETELPEARRGFDGAKPVDGHPWIWRQLRQELGYATQWGEDGAHIGTFTYRMLGFQNQPVDHYLRPFYLALERRYSLYQPYCLGSIPRHQNMMAWQRDFFDLYGHDCRKFSFVFHSELSHDSNRLLPIVDRDFRQHLADLNAAGHLNRTALVLMSDHGARFDDTRRTSRGKYEERLPFLAVRLPPDYVRRHPEAAENLRRNAKEDRLVTAFDLHETLLDFAGLSNDQRKSSEAQSRMKTHETGNKRRRGLSLLREIPHERTCDEADIAPHWCTCLQWRPVSFDDQRVRQAAQSVIETVNRLTSARQALCHRFAIGEISTADMYAADERLLLFRRSADADGRVPEMASSSSLSGDSVTGSDVHANMVNGTEVLYRVTVSAEPGNALFEATVRMRANNLEDRKWVNFEVDERQISRINAYGNQPHCIAQSEPHLRPFCNCIESYSSTQSEVTAAAAVAETAIASRTNATV